MQRRWEPSLQAGWDGISQHTVGTQDNPLATGEVKGRCFGTAVDQVTCAAVVHIVDHALRWQGVSTVPRECMSARELQKLLPDQNQPV